MSPDDRMGYVMPKLEKYRKWGVPNIWIADPGTRKLFTCGAAGLHEGQVLELPAYQITLSAIDVFGA